MKQERENEATERTDAGRDLLQIQRRKAQKGPIGVNARRWSLQHRQSRSLRDQHKDSCSTSERPEKKSSWVKKIIISFSEEVSTPLYQMLPSFKKRFFLFFTCICNLNAGECTTEHHKNLNFTELMNSAAGVPHFDGNTKHFVSQHRQLPPNTQKPISCLFISILDSSARFHKAAIFTC